MSGVVVLMLCRRRICYWMIIGAAMMAMVIPNTMKIEAFNIPLPGGRRIAFDNDGVIRIRWKGEPSSSSSSLSSDNKSPRLAIPPIGTQPLQETMDSIIIKHTGTIKGYGAFCRNKPIEAYTFLGFYEGTIIRTRDELERIYPAVAANGCSSSNSMDYVMSLDGGVTFIDGYGRSQNRTIFSPVHLNHEDSSSYGCNCIRILSDLDDTSDAPTTIENSSTSRRVAFFTSRRIEINEELCFDYGNEYWAGRENEKL